MSKRLNSKNGEFASFFLRIFLVRIGLTLELLSCEVVQQDHLVVRIGGYQRCSRYEILLCFVI